MNTEVSVQKPVFLGRTSELSDLKQVLATESPFKMMKNVFYFTFISQDN